MSCVQNELEVRSRMSYGSLQISTETTSGGEVMKHAEVQTRV